jgi:dUTP pyrophosphatase
MTPLRYARWNSDAAAPLRKHPTDAGVDVFAIEDKWIWPFSAARVKTGLTFEIRADFMLLAKPKSGSDYLLGAGVIDPGYQGEILIKIVNYKPWPLRIRKGQALAQLVQVAILTDPLEGVASIDDLHSQKSARGEDGGIVRQK